MKMTTQLRAWLLLPLCVLAACERERTWPELRERVGDHRVIVRASDGQLFVSSDGGNLARGTAATPQQREQRFAEFLNEFGTRLGFAGASGPLQFQPGASQMAIALDATPLQMVFLEPVHRGAAIVDRPQSAAFAAGTDELRAVLARGVDFATLPEPIVGDSASVERARAAVLRQFGASDPGAITVKPEPVISAEHRRAGYLVEHRRTDPSGAGVWVRALFDPRDGALVVLQREERDDVPPRTGAVR